MGEGARERNRRGERDGGTEGKGGGAGKPERTLVFSGKLDPYKGPCPNPFVVDVWV